MGNLNEEMGDWIEKWAKYSPKSMAVTCLDSNRAFNYAELRNAKRNLAHKLAAEWNIASGDRVAVFAQNSLEYYVLFFAVQALGAILVPINFRWREAELEHVLQDCSPKVLFYQKDVIPDRALHNSEIGAKVDIRDLVLDSSELPNSVGLVENHDSESPCMIIYTSGTTGHAKGATISRRMIFWNSINTTLRLNLSQTDRTLTFAPFFHTGGWHVLTTPLLHRGAQIFLLKKFDPSAVVRAISKHKLTIFFGVPTIMEMMSSTAEFKDADFSSLRYAVVGGEPMPIRAIERWNQKGVPIRQGYGLTEYGPNVFSLNEEHAIRKMGSIGFPNFYVNVRVVDSLGADVAVNEPGELLLSGPCMMSGYWGNAKASNEVSHDGWLRTGDLVKRDADGFFYVVGRIKEMYISGGENVYPAEIERVIRELSWVKEVAVIGVPDEKWGEVGRAFVSLADQSLDESSTLQALHAHCVTRLAKFKVPRYFKLVDDLPKGENGKILKKLLNQ